MRFRFPALVAVLLISLSQAGCIIDLGSLTGRTEPLQELVVYGDSGPKLLMLQIDGPITHSARNGGLISGSAENMVSRVRETLAMAQREGVRGILVRLETPGGSVTGTEQIHRMLLDYKRTNAVPIVAQCMGTAASGGYYIATAADEIRAYPSSLIGSIGVILTGGPNLSGLMERFGVADQTIVSGPHKDTLSPYRPMRDDERAELQGLVDEMHSIFVDAVDEGRPDLTRDQVLEAADGRIFSARRSKELGLIDELGTLEEAIGALEARAGLSKSRVVSFHRENEWENNIYSRTTVRAPSPGAADAVRDLLGRSLPPGAYFLWPAVLGR